MSAPDLPWDDCKVAFGVEDDRLLDVVSEKPAAERLPRGWDPDEVDGAGARWVLIFRVEGIPTVEDGQRVRALLDELTKALPEDEDLNP